MRFFVTGCGGLVGSAFAEYAHSLGHHVSGVDSDQRGRWFGHAGSVEWRITELKRLGITIHRSDFRDPDNLRRVADADVVLHCASQPSHDFSRDHVLQDSAVNYTGTVELLEACRRWAPKAIVIFISTNKVYGDRVNTLEYVTDGRRYVLKQAARGVDPESGVNEDFPIDDTQHTPFGVSKLAADLMVQEYRRTFGMTTVTFRCGCLTGTQGSAVELQGFLGYLVKCAIAGEPYTIYGHGGYQVRDNIDAVDLARAIMAYAENPKGDVYNMGGGSENAISVMEAVTHLRERHGCEFKTWIGNARVGDHRWWISDCSRFERDYPTWKRQRNVYEVLDALVLSERSRRGVTSGDAALVTSPLTAPRLRVEPGGASAQPAGARDA